MKYLMKYQEIISKTPLESVNHFYFARDAFKRGFYNLANAELKCAEFLGHEKSDIEQIRKENNQQLPALDVLDVNQFQRFTVLKSYLDRLTNKGDSILDIGGGHGILSRFMPEHDYFLIEPSVNGISGLELPFNDNTFDVVVTCHVLEHIPQDQRERFIDELVRVARKSVLIFNPFKIKELDEVSRLELVLDITGAEWAKEHLECGFPYIEETTNYIKSKDLQFNVDAFGDIYTATATVFMSYFASKVNPEALEKINRHLNVNYDQLNRSDYPTNYMIEITR